VLLELVLRLFYILIALGLSWGTDDASLRDAFAHFGDVVDGKLHLFLV